MTTTWVQLNLHFADPARAERAAVEYLAPALEAAEASSLITAWFFIRKTPCWRLRYLPTDQAAAHTHPHPLLAGLQHSGQLNAVTEVVYEPETRAFGGGEAMTVAHRLWHLDSRHLLTHLAGTRNTGAGSHRRELSLILLSALLRSASLDWYEQGDVWAKVAAHRHPPEGLNQHVAALTNRVQRLLSVDTSDLTGPGRPLETTVDWLHAYTAAGRDLAHLHTAGLLRRGIRDICAHHVIFAWNRLGLPEATQALLASAAAAVVFGLDSSTASPTPPLRTAVPAGTRP